MSDWIGLVWLVLLLLGERVLRRRGIRRHGGEALPDRTVRG